MRPPYSPEELAIIVEYYPDLDKLVKLLPGRSRAAITMKAQGLGLSKKRDADWTLPELRIVRRLYPDVDAIRKLLPHRTQDAIRTRGSLLGVAVKAKQWTPARQHLLERLYADLSDKEAGAVLGVSEKAVCTQRLRKGLRKRTESKRIHARLLLVQDIRDEAKRRGLKIEKITNALGYKAPSAMSCSSAAKVVSALGGELYAEWED